MLYANRVLSLAVVAGICITGIGLAAATMHHDVTVTQDGVENVDALVETYNNHSDQLPPAIASVIGGERINANISVDDGHVVYGIVMDGKKIDRVEDGGIDNPTLRVYTSADTIDAITSADNPRQRAVAAFNSDEIEYEAVGFVNKIKFGVMSIMMQLFGSAAG